MRLFTPSPKDSPLAVSAGLLFACLWCACLVFYPQWYIPGTITDRVMTLSLIWFALAAGVAFTVWFFWDSHEPLVRQPVAILDIAHKIWPILLLALCAHLPFLTAPIVTGLDAQEHAGVPAVLVAFARCRLPIPIPFIAWPLLIACGFLIRKLFRLPLKLNTLTYTSILLFVAGCAAAALLIKTQAIERIGADHRFISRYPPLGRFLFLGAYVLFGIHEWGGRATQLFLSILAAIYLYRTCLLFASETAGLLAATLLLFLPPMFHYGNLNMLDCGTVAFAVAAQFYLLRYLEESQKRDLCLTLFLLTAGVLYKRVLVLLLPAAFLQWLVYRLNSSSRTTLHRLWPEATGFLLPIGTAILTLWLSQLNPDIPMRTARYKHPPLLHLVRPEYLFAPLYSLPTAFTWPILASVLLGPAVILLNKEKSTRRLLANAFLWYGGYTLCYVLWETPGNIRQAMPSYPALLLLAAVTLDWILNSRTLHHPSLFSRTIWTVLLLYLLWVVLLLPRQPPSPDHRPIKDSTWMNLTNRSSFYLPYPRMMRSMAHRVPAGAVVYAPMANEPSKFYLAAYGLWGRWKYLGDPWVIPINYQTLDGLKEYCSSNNVSYLLLPDYRWGQMALSQHVLHAIEEGGVDWLTKIEEAVAGTERLTLYKILR